MSVMKTRRKLDVLALMMSASTLVVDFVVSQSNAPQDLLDERRQYPSGPGLGLYNWYIYF